MKIELSGNEPTFEELNEDLSLPEESGIYCVVMPAGFELVFLERTEGIAVYKEKECSRDIEYLESRVSDDTNILYIGKAKNIKQRIKQYLDFGYNRENFRPHSGGKFIWQIKDNKKLKVYYKVCDHPECEEARLIDEYIIEHHKYPFANCKRGNKVYGLLLDKEVKKILNSK